MNSGLASDTLPIHAVMGSLKAHLQQRNELVLQAPPGAGKTTAVPLALLHEAWLGDGKILMLEPRRMAARTAATRMAELLGERVGETVGYRIRLEQRVSEATRIEVITEGILVRRLQSDPELSGVALVIFDEFHERSLDSDLSLALTLQAREVFREPDCPLRVLVMSATLDGEGVAELLDDAPIVSSSGRQYPVSVQYEGEPAHQRDLPEAVGRAVGAALGEWPGNVLAFLPGQGEIERTMNYLQQSDRVGKEVVLAPLYGGLTLQQQRRAIEAPPAGHRKVVLATNIAETSLTIDGINTVVDGGLARIPLYDPARGMTRLATRRISRASAEQRTGRAGRLGPGHCYRLWSEEEQRRLVAHAESEIMQADLSSLALQLLAFGVGSPAELRWLDSPPLGAYQQALDLLRRCGALLDNGVVPQLTPHGVAMAQLPMHPRLAHMMLVGLDCGEEEAAASLAALLGERVPPLGQGVDLAAALEVLLGNSACPPALKGWLKRTRQQAASYRQRCARERKPPSRPRALAAEDRLAVLLAQAYPDRIARCRNRAEGRYQLANGRYARLPADDPLTGSEWIVAAEVGGREGVAAREDRIFSACALESRLFADQLVPLVERRDIARWDDGEARFIALRQRVIGSLVLESEPLSSVPDNLRTAALLDVLRRRGLSLLPWTPALRQWQARVALLRAVEGSEGPWPDLSDAALLASLETWLLPYLNKVWRLADFAQLDLRTILQSQLPWPLPMELEQQAPERITVPGGSHVAINYEQSPPVLAVKLQEMFGCEATPTVAGGRVPVLLHLLSPAGRPLQVTQNLASFWRDGYHEVRKEMKGRYPKHPWPEDPLTAQATRHTKRRQERG